MATVSVLPAHSSPAPRALFRTMLLGMVRRSSRIQGFAVGYSPRAEFISEKASSMAFVTDAGANISASEIYSFRFH